MHVDVLMRVPTGLLPSFAVVVAFVFAGPLTASAAVEPTGRGEVRPGDAERFSGLYHGAILYREGGTELEIFVELAPGADGGLVGTLDMPAYEDVTYKPLENFAVDRREIYFSYRHDSEVRGPNALFEFEGELSEDGRMLAGGFLETRGRIPFRLERIGDAGSERPVMETRPLADLNDAADGLRQAFNAHADEARLVLLLSPT